MSKNGHFTEKLGNLALKQILVTFLSLKIQFCNWHFKNQYGSSFPKHITDTF